MNENNQGMPNNFIFRTLEFVSPYFILNLAWFVLCMPIITIFPATAGLYYATNLLHRDGDASLVDLWQGIRQYFKVSWLWGGLNLLVYAIISVNFWFYGNYDAIWAIWLRSVVIIVGLMWTCIQFYTFPLLIMQDDKRLRVALRNSYIAVILRPFPTLGWVLVVFLIAYLTTSYALPFWVVISASICLYISNRATRNALDFLPTETITPTDEEAPSDTAEPNRYDP